MMPQINDGLFFPELVMGLRRAGMNTVTGQWHRHHRRHGHDEPDGSSRPAIPILQEAARSIGGWAVRNMATVGGNLFNQPPYGDFASPCWPWTRKSRFRSAASERMVDLNEFLTGGRQLEADELITEAPHPPSQRPAAFQQVRPARRQTRPRSSPSPRRSSMPAASVTAARVALGGADTTARRSPEAEAVLNQRAPGSEMVDALRRDSSRGGGRSQQPHHQRRGQRLVPPADD